MNSFSTNTEHKRVSSKHLFLTYKPFEGNLTHFKKWLFNFLTPYVIAEHFIIIETGKSILTKKHLHCFVKLHKKLDTRNIKQFIYYPNIKNATGIMPYIQNPKHPVYFEIYEETVDYKNLIEYLLKQITDISNAINNNELDVSSLLLQRITNKGVLEPPHKASIRLAEEGKIVEALTLLKEYDPINYTKNYKVYAENLTAMHLDNHSYSFNYKFNTIIISPYPELETIFNIILNAIPKKEPKFLYVCHKNCEERSLIVRYLLHKHFKFLQPFVITTLEELLHYDPQKYNSVLFNNVDFKNYSTHTILKALSLETSVIHLRPSNSQSSTYIINPSRLTNLFSTAKGLTSHHNVFRIKQLKTSLVKINLPKIFLKEFNNQTKINFKP
jgi:hypothetical protein